MHLRLVFVPRRFFIAYFPVNNSLVPAGADKFLTGILLQLKRPRFGGPLYIIPTLSILPIHGSLYRRMHFFPGSIFSLRLIAAMAIRSLW